MSIEQLIIAIYAVLFLGLGGLCVAELIHRRALRHCVCVSCTVDRSMPAVTNGELVLGVLVFTAAGVIGMMTVLNSLAGGV